MDMSFSTASYPLFPTENDLIRFLYIQNEKSEHIYCGDDKIVGNCILRRLGLPFTSGFWTQDTGDEGNGKCSSFARSHDRELLLKKIQNGIEKE